MRLLTAAIDCAGHLVAPGRLLRFSLAAREMARFLEGVAEHDLRLSTQTGLQIHPSVGEWGRSPLCLEPLHLRVTLAPRGCAGNRDIGPHARSRAAVPGQPRAGGRSMKDITVESTRGASHVTRSARDVILLRFRASCSGMHPPGTGQRGLPAVAYSAGEATRLAVSNSAMPCWIAGGEQGGVIAIDMPQSRAPAMPA